MRTFNGGDNEPKVEHIYFSAVGAGASSPTALKGRGVTSLVYSATGVLVLTLTENFVNFLGLNLCVKTATTALARNVAITAFDGAAKTVTLTMFDAATPTATDLETTNTGYFELIISRTGQPL